LEDALLRAERTCRQLHQDDWGFAGWLRNTSDGDAQVRGSASFQGRWRPRERYRRFHDPARACSLVGAIPWLADVGVGCLRGDPLRAAMMVARQSEAVPRLGVAGAQGPPGTERVAAGRERHVQRDDVLGRRDALGLADSGRTGHRPGTAAFQWTVTPFSVTSTPRSAAAQLWVRVGTTSLLSFDPARLVLSWIC
jgi:hypothetical protein